MIYVTKWLYSYIVRKTGENGNAINALTSYNYYGNRITNPEIQPAGIRKPKYL